MANLHLIRNLCEAKKITIRELASRIGRNESAIQALIRSGSTNTGTLEAIAAVLNVPAGYFFDGWESCEKNPDLSKEVEHLKALLEEKERSINILLNKIN